MPTGYVDVVSADSVGLPARTLLRTDRNNFAPRIGVAYRPFGGARTVLRGGTACTTTCRRSISRRRARHSCCRRHPSPIPRCRVVLPTVFPAAGTSGPATIGLPLAVNPDIGLPYTHQWNATVEHERWNTGFRVSYVATLGRAMWYKRDANAPVADGRLYVEKPRPFPQFPDIIYADKGGSHDYHGVTFEAERRFSQGCFFRLRTQPRGTPTANDGIYTTPIENPFDLARERGRDVATPRIA